MTSSQFEKIRDRHVITIQHAVRRWLKTKNVLRAKTALEVDKEDGEEVKVEEEEIVDNGEEINTFHKEDPDKEAYQR